MKNFLLGLARLFGLHSRADVKRYGTYRGVVVDNKDPQKSGRLKLKIPTVSGDQTPGWALPCLPSVDGHYQRMFVVPEVGAQVWVEFEEGEIQSPIWTGVSEQASCDPAETAGNADPDPCQSLTKCCQFIECDDTVGKEFIRLHHPTQSEMILEPNGSVSIRDASGAVLRMDAENNEIIVEDSHGNSLSMKSSGIKVEDSSDNVIVMSASGITVKAPEIVIEGAEVHLGDTGGEPVIKGQSFLGLFATHIHTSAPVVGGPTSPPIPQGETSTLSTTVKTI